METKILFDRSSPFPVFIWSDKIIKILCYFIYIHFSIKSIDSWCVLKSGSHHSNFFFHLLDWKPFKNDGKCFLFHLKSSFRSQDIKVFVTTFWSCRKNDLIRKIKTRLTSKFMTSQPGLQTITIHIIPNVSQSKYNQTMKFGHLIDYNKRNIFLQKLYEKSGRETSSRPLFIFLKSLIWGESKWSAA